MKKKGFTLIELLAVIIILAVIALIATPIVLNVVNNAKESARKNSIQGYADAVKLARNELMLQQNTDNPDISDLEVNYKGDRVYCKTVGYHKDHGVVLDYCTANGKDGQYFYLDGKVYTERPSDMDVIQIDSQTVAKSLIDTLMGNINEKKFTGFKYDASKDEYYSYGSGSYNYLLLGGSRWKIVSYNLNNKTIKLMKDSAIKFTETVSSWHNDLSKYENNALNSYLNTTFYDSLTALTKGLILKANYCIGPYDNNCNIQTNQNVGLITEDEYNRAALLNLSYEQAVMITDGATSEKEWASWYTMNGESTTVQQIIEEYGRSSFEDFVINDIGYADKQSFADAVGIIYNSENDKFSIYWSDVTYSTSLFGNTYDESNVRGSDSIYGQPSSISNTNNYNIEPIITISDIKINNGIGSFYQPYASYKYSEDTTTATVKFSTNKNPVDGWFSDNFYVNINLGYGFGGYFKWCSTTGETCTPNVIKNATSEKVYITTPSATNKVCVIAYNSSGIAGEKVCSPDYKLYKPTNITSPKQLSDIVYSEYKGVEYDSSNNLYYYKGSKNVVDNNFVWYEGHLWRILEVDKNTNEITMITQQPITAIQSWNGGMWSNEQQYKNSYINTWLNNVFYNSINDKSKMKQSIFNIGPYNNVSEITTTQYVGLLDEMQYENSKDKLGKSFLNISDLFWLGNRSSADNRVVDNNGNLGNTATLYNLGVRVVIKITDLTITSGNGTIKNPFKEESISTNTNNIKVGEYVSVPCSQGNCNGTVNNGRWLFRVVSKDNDSIKVILNGVLPTKSEFDVSNVTFANSSTIYTPLLNFSNSISNIYRYIGEKTFNIGMYGLATDYTTINSKTYSGSVGLPVIGEMFSGNDIDIGTGEKQFVNVNTIENPKASNDFWEMNPYSSTRVLFVGNFGGIYGSDSSASVYGVRPVIFLNKGDNTDLTFTKGDGTAENPYWLGN